jgi:hypothetical protein
MALNKGRQFSTLDADRDGYALGNCAQIRKSAWWFNLNDAVCTYSNPNGPYTSNTYCPAATSYPCPYWYTYGTLEFASLKTVVMKVRPL